MDRTLSLLVLGGLTLIAGAQAQPDSQSMPKSSLHSDRSGAGAVDVPPLPHGKSTIIGGKIRSVDPVKDQMTLQAYGEKPMKILFDERTQVFVDGKRIALRELGPAEHASVQTTLDGADVFAVSVHILSGAPKGSYTGRVLSYDPNSGLLVLTGDASSQPFRVSVSKDTPVKREGQAAFTAENRGQFDLVRGALISLSFEPGSHGQGVAKDITVFATPGATFVFSGTVTALDVHAGYLVLTDSRDNKRYQIHFDTGGSGAANLHIGDHLRITADYDGTRYVATDLAAR